MASKFTMTTPADDTEQTVCAAACRLTAIEVLLNVAQTACYLQLWDSADPDPGTTAPLMVIPVPTVAIQGLMRKFKVIFPNGGYRFGTALTMLATTTATGETAVTTTAIPQRVDIFYVTG